ncbi:MAG: septum formation protein Maf [Betaproteobacteria bacterium]|nr:septum formation protein Maf [Betaproteobacteria bacterium]
MVFSSEDRLVLASGSRYRKALLEQLRLRYSVCPADIDESPLHDESPAALATRLACQKARAVAPRYPDSLIIGSDQVASIDGRSAFSKPLDHAGAVAQLRAMSGRTVLFHTAVCVLNAARATQRTALVPTEVHFRQLASDVIETYLRADQPYDCAGSARIEGLGIALVDRVRSDDPSALLGLPLIALLDLLAAEGVSPL